MEIVLDEAFPLLRTLLEGQLKEKTYRDRVHLLSPGETENRTDLVLSDRSFFPPFPETKARLFIVPSDARGAVSSRRVLPAGMGHQDPVTFSSLREDRALLCLQKPVLFRRRLFEPQERWVKVDPFYSLFKNLAVQTALFLCDEIFGEGRE